MKAQGARIYDGIFGTSVVSVSGPDDDQFLTWNERGTQDSDTNCSSIPSSIASSDISFREKVELLNAVTKAMQATTQPLRKDSIN